MPFALGIETPVSRPAVLNVHTFISVSKCTCNRSTVRGNTHTDTYLLVPIAAIEENAAAVIVFVDLLYSSVAVVIEGV